MNFCKLLVILVGLWIIGLGNETEGGGALGSPVASPEAYVTLLYGDEFLLGVRVLGKSIRDTGSTKDMVALVSDGVSDYAKSLLRVCLNISFGVLNRILRKQDIFTCLIWQLQMLASIEKTIQFFMVKFVSFFNRETD